jgi:heme/copper-type cytochrome/quinol oxidase subunit 3
MQANSTNARQTHDAGEESSRSRYRPALLVIYASLISIYLGLRFIVLGEAWPTRDDLQLAVWWAAIGTAALVLSSVTLGMAKHASQSGQLKSTRQWLLLTLAIGIAFAVLQSTEFRRRWQQNLIPKPFNNSLHDRADLYFLSAVQRRLMQLATEINSDKVRQNQLIQRLQNAPDSISEDRVQLDAELSRLKTEESLRTERLAIVNRLLASEARWTALVVANTDSLARQRLAIAALAYDVKPHRTFKASHEQFRELERKELDERQATDQASLVAAEALAKENSQPIKGLLNAVTEAKVEQQELESQLKAYLRQRALDEEFDEGQEDEDPRRIALESQLAGVRLRLEERTAKLSAAAKLVTDAEDSVSRLAEEIRDISARRATIAELDGGGVGLNQKYPWLRLPVCLPVGTVWAWTYFVLTTVHAIHLAYVLIGVLVLTMLSGVVSSSSLEPWVRNWHTMSIVWGILFLLIYLI